MDEMLFALAREIPAYIKKCNEALPAEDHRFGGYLCVYHSTQLPGQPPLLIMSIGDPPAEKISRYFELCQEKAARLLANPTDLSSWQSRDVEKCQYGGGIRTRDHVLAFSGHIEKADEAVLVNAACTLGWMESSTAGAIASFSDNKLITV